MSAAPKKRLGELLLEAGVIDATQLKAALGHQRQWGVRLGQALVDMKLAREPDIVQALSRKFGYEVARLGEVEPYAFEQALKLVPRDFAVRYNVFPLSADTASITVAMSDPTNLAVVDELRFRTGRRVKACIGGDREITAAVRLHYPGGDAVEAIALDLDVDDLGEPMLDPFGGGSNDAFETFFGSAPAAGALAPRPAAPPAQPRPAMPAAQAVRATVPPSSPPRQASPRAPLPPPAPHPLELEDAPEIGGARPALVGAVAESGLAAGPEEPTPYPVAEEELHGEPVLAMDLAPAEEETVEGRLPTRPLSPEEVGILEALDRLAGGAPAEPDIVKPAQAMAAVIRLLLRRRIVTEQEFLDELLRR